ncbi:MAG: hypothetical protein GWM92_07890 [Gemmatimonadetes bacterium]|nr:hypothetical protein [Gemmatimonadota bacterium]NIR77942.1 hypothetical protein [Gemmatimonadota bacterium]NIT87162.1 hypothetical protein [Gemmatimonadota bacterium]NIU30329.1 hypothetical protein [Gemmatimonadota bacterium]NIU35220.1 hypothetical protein [Gemmatimonadota bacterium]
MTVPKIEFVYFEGCPNADAARERLGKALDRTGRPREWKEWEMGDPEIPESHQAYGSPTVLVDGEPVADGDVATDGRACRADGGPSGEEIERALRARS